MKKTQHLFSLKNQLNPETVDIKKKIESKMNIVSFFQNSPLSGLKLNTKKKNSMINVSL